MGHMTHQRRSTPSNLLEKLELRLCLATVVFPDWHLISSDADGAESVYVGDIDGDMDMDVLSASGHQGKIAWYENRLVGDSNDDGVFDSSDFVLVFQVGKYEDGILSNSTFDEGDWNGDGDFDSSDFVLAFQAGVYEAAARLPSSGLAAAVDTIFAQLNPRARPRAYLA